MPIDRPAGEDERRSTPADTLPGQNGGQKIEDELNLQQEVDVLREAILRLKEQERVVLSLYYFEELKLHEIATILELTESRVSQIRSKAIAKLRGEMAPLREQVA
jgi:RNA polymerase sigma factor for flagellar operon FliA